MSYTKNQEQDFKDLITDEIRIPANILPLALQWIKDHLNPELVFDDSELDDWAISNGYVKNSE